MKKVFLSSLIAVFSFVFVACDDDDNNSDSGKKNEPVNENITMGANYAQDVFYSLKNGVIATVNRAQWDIGFHTSIRSSSIIINSASGVELVVAPAENWTDAIDTTGMTWNKLYNSNETWEEGAFGRNATGHPDYGWGVYDMTTHNLTGTSVYIIKLMSGEYKKLQIIQKLSADNIYEFKYANIDGSSEESVTLDLSASTNKNFIYYNLATNQKVDIEPAGDSWDLVFTRYWDENINYMVSGVLQNIGAQAIEVKNADVESDAFDQNALSDAITIIGSDWKSFDMSTFVYTLDETLVFFVKDLNNDVYKLRFTGFDGSSTGNIAFEKKLVAEGITVEE